MKLLNEEKMSMWAFFECKNGNNTPEMRKLITNEKWAYIYCLDIKDRLEVRKYIK